MARDREILDKLAKLTIANLSLRNIQPLRLLSGQKSVQTYTDGWAISIGNIYGYQASAQIWLDKFSNHLDRKIWFGLFCENISPNFNQLIDLVNKKFGEPFKVIADDMVFENNICSLSNKLPKSRFGQRILEEHEVNKYYYYGIYEFEVVPDKLERIVNRISDFYCDIIELLKNANSSENEDYLGVENRKTVKTHILRERDRYISTLRKQEDNYICQICDFNFFSMYGDIGKDFAEAHHIIPLNNNNEVRFTRVDDLITVCANCHRMLHRMSGEQKDIEELKRIVKEC